MSEEMNMILGQLEKMDAKLGRLDAVEEKLGRLDAVEEKLGRLDAVEEKLGRLDAVEEKLGRLDTLEAKITEVQMTLDNDINKKISIIAEGHLDLSRKLDEALKVEMEKEILLLRVTSMETDIRRIKERIGESA